MFLKDSSGNKSMTATMSIVAFSVVLLKFLLSGAVITAGDFSHSFGEIDPLAIAAILTPVLGTYAFRRHTAATYGEPSAIPIDEEDVVEEITEDHGR